MRRAICKYFYPADKRKRGGNKVEYSTAFYIPMKNTLGGGWRGDLSFYYVETFLRLRYA